MSFGRYRNTPLTIDTLADSINGLLSHLVISPDIMTAAEHVPFQFHPGHDAAFYNDIYWCVPHEVKIAAAKSLMRRFDRWYPRASPFEQVYMTVSALTESDDGIDTLIDDTKAEMIARHRMEIQDCDGAFYLIPDFHATRDPFNVSNALNTPRFDWWKTNFEQQARRVLAAPHIPFGDFLLWNKARVDRETMIRTHFARNKNTFTRKGVTVRQGRRVLIRSYRLCEGFFGNFAVREFIKGKPLKIRGHHFEWELRMDQRELIDYTLTPPHAHTPYTMFLNDLSGNKLGHACVVFENTPLLDQAVAVGLSVSNPDDELDLLQRTNIFRLTTAGLKDEKLKRLKLPGLTRTRPEVPWDDEGETPVWERAEQWVNQATEAIHRGYVARREAEREPDWDDDAEEVDLPGRMTVRVFEEEQPFELEANEMIDDLSAIVVLPNTSLREGSFRGRVVNLFREVLIDKARTCLMRERDPIASRVREEMYRRLDVRPDVLEYMAKPEFGFHYLNRLKRAPVLEAFISHGVPLGLGVRV